MDLPEQIQQLKQQVADTGYIADAPLVASLHLMLTLGKPLLLEGEAGVGKTGIASCLAKVSQARLIRLQCYEGLDAQHALYDWDYRRQLLAIQQQAQVPGGGNIYTDEFLLQRPLLAALSSEQPVVLLIDEIDRADEEFEALLLEVLSEFQISIPELGTITAKQRPQVLLTSNGVRELSDALRRRCLYHYIDYPDPDKELAIVQAHIPGIESGLAQQLVSLVQQLRTRPLRKTPGVAETLDWAAALMALSVSELENQAEQVFSTLSCVLKTHEDQMFMRQADEMFGSREALNHALYTPTATPPPSDNTQPG